MMHNFISINMKYDEAGIERVLQCVRYRRFILHKLSYQLLVGDEIDIAITVSGELPIHKLIVQLEKLYGVEKLECK